jgi:GNAT superfamily N-acetyltransferase
MKRLYLSPASRGLGIGKKLVDEVIKEAKRLGMRR